MSDPFPQKLESGKKKNQNIIYFLNCKRHTVLLSDYETKSSTTGETNLRHY